MKEEEDWTGRGDHDQRPRGGEGGEGGSNTPLRPPARFPVTTSQLRSDSRKVLLTWWIISEEEPLEFHLSLVGGGGTDAARARQQAVAKDDGPQPLRMRDSNGNNVANSPSGAGVLLPFKNKEKKTLFTWSF